jgi:hypothetical protein
MDVDGRSPSFWQLKVCAFLTPWVSARCASQGVAECDANARGAHATYMEIKNIYVVEHRCEGTVFRRMNVGIITRMNKCL